MRGSVLHHAAGSSENRLAVHKIKSGRIEAALIASTEKGLEKPVVERIRAFLSRFDYRRGTLGQPRDFLRQRLVPKLPAKALRHQLGDLASSASVFPFNGNDFDHTHAAFSETLD